MADDDDVVYPLISNDDLIAAGLLPEDDDDIRDDAAALLGIDVGSGSAPIDLDGGYRTVLAWAHAMPGRPGPLAIYSGDRGSGFHAPFWP